MEHMKVWIKEIKAVAGIQQHTLGLTNQKCRFHETKSRDKQARNIFGNSPRKRTQILGVDETKNKGINPQTLGLTNQTFSF